MRWLISVLLLLLPMLGSAAEWLYIGSRVESNGCLLKLTLSTAPNLDATTAAVTNLSFFNGFGTNNSITHTTAMTATITGMGFNPSTGATGPVVRIAYGTIIERLPDPLENTNNILAQNVTNVTLGVWLSEYVYSNDTISISALAGAVASTNLTANTNLQAFTATATNGSVIPYDAAKCITRWTEAPYRIITNNTFYAKLKAFNRHGIASVQCIARDEHSNWFTNRQSAPQIDRNGIDAVPTAKFIFPMDMSSFTNGDEIRFDFRAEPLVGSEASVQSTLDGVNIRGPNYAPQYYRLDRLNNWGLAWCHVDPTNGNNSTAVVSSNATFGAANAFTTIGAALDACALSNAIWYGTTRSNTANARIFLAPGKHNWMGAQPTKGNPFPNPAPLITGNPTNASRYSVWLHQAPISEITDDYSRRMHLYDVLIGFTNLFGFVSGNIDHLFLDRCTIDCPPQLFNAITNSYTIGCVISNLPSGFTGVQHAPQIIGGNWFYNTNDCEVRTFCQYGNRRMVNIGNAAISGPVVNTTWAAVQGPAPDRAICEGNALVGLNVSGGIAIKFYSDDGCTNGGYFGNNIVENTNRSIITSLVSISSDSPSTNATNIVVEGNVMVGGRLIFAYNDTGSSPWYRVLFALRNNLIDDYNCKTDILTPSNGARTGNWPCIFSVSASGNISPDSSFPSEFRGLNSYMQDLNTPTNWFQFTTSGSAVVGSVSGSGLGDYRLLSHSPVFKLTTHLRNYRPPPAWSYDIGGHTDSALKPAGAYGAGQRKRGAMF